MDGPLQRLQALDQRHHAARGFGGCLCPTPPRLQSLDWPQASHRGSCPPPAIFAAVQQAVTRIRRLRCTATALIAGHAPAADTPSLLLGQQASQRGIGHERLSACRLQHRRCMYILRQVQADPACTTACTAAASMHSMQQRRPSEDTQLLRRLVLPCLVCGRAQAEHELGLWDWLGGPSKKPHLPGPGRAPHPRVSTQLDCCWWLSAAGSSQKSSPQPGPCACRRQAPARWPAWGWQSLLVWVGT